MSDLNNHESVEARLAAYGTVLQGHLDGEQDDRTTGMLLVGGFGTQNAATTPRRKPTLTVLSVAAAVILAVGLLVPSLVGNTPAEPITVNGGDVASAPEAGGADDADDPQTGGDSATEGEDGKLVDEADGELADTDEANDGGDADRDWTAFSVTVGGSQDHSDEPAQDDPLQSDDGTKLGIAAVAPGESDGGGETSDGSDESDEADKEAQPSVDCPGDKELRAEGCVLIGTPPVLSPGGCPSGAVIVGQQCYEIVAPTCGELPAASDGSGCLKLIGAASAEAGCPDNYELDGATCVKLVAPPLSCSQGTPSGDACLIKETPTGGDSGCGDGHTQFGNGCYELSSPTSHCDGLATLADGACRLPVEGQESTECPAGLQPWEDICYRYEDPPTFDCAGGESDGGGWCLMTEEGTPGPEACDDGVLQDEQGCYVLVEPNDDGNCGELPEFEGMCRKAKPSYQTWACSNGETVYEPTCKVWTEAFSVSCAAGEPVENNTKCKTIQDPISTAGCPANAFEDSEGCYKSKAPQLGCGELAKTPDGQHCKTWISDAEASASCTAGFELVGNYCKKYVEGVVGTCSGAESVVVNGAPRCMYTTEPAASATGCGAGAIEQAGNCYLVVAPDCEDLDVDLYGKGCKKPVDVEPALVCETGFTLVGDECIKKN